VAEGGGRRAIPVAGRSCGATCERWMDKGGRPTRDDKAVGKKKYKK
jgi:hypothetical protein